MPEHRSVGVLLKELSFLDEKLRSLSRSRRSLNEKKVELSRKRHLFDALVKAFSEWSRQLTPKDVSSFQESVSRAESLFTSISSSCGSHTLWGAKEDLLKIKRAISPSLLSEAKEHERKERERMEKARAFSKELLAFSGRLLEGGSACIGAEYLGVSGHGQALQDLFSANKDTFSAGMQSSWGSGFSFKGRKAAATYGRTSTYGFETSHLVVLSGRELMGAESDPLAGLAWLLDEALLCSFFFYAGDKVCFRNAGAKGLLGMFGSFGGITVKKKATSMHVELRMQENAKPSEARDFYNRLVSLTPGGGLELKAHYDGVEVVKKSANWLSDDKKFFSAKLYGYLDGNYKPFLDANWDLCNSLYSRHREGKLALNADESPNIGGVSLYFKLPAGSEYPQAVLDCADFVLSFFEGRRAHPKGKIRSPESDYAAGLFFSLD